MSAQETISAWMRSALPTAVRVVHVDKKLMITSDGDSISGVSFPVTGLCYATSIQPRNIT
jgi:hypothetical protein